MPYARPVVNHEPMHEALDAAVAALRQTCFGRESSAAEVRAERERAVCEAWVTLDGERLVGFAFLQVVLDEAELHDVGVDPARRREGIALALLERAFEAARARGARRLFLEVSRENRPAIALYEAMGFSEQSVRESYYADGSDALVMTLLLEA